MDFNKHCLNNCLTHREKSYFEDFNLRDRPSLKELETSNAFKVVTSGIYCYPCKVKCIESFKKRNGRDLTVFFLDEINHYYNKQSGMIALFTKTLIFVLTIIVGYGTFLATGADNSINIASFLSILVALLFLYYLATRMRLKDIKKRDNIIAFLKHALRD